MTSTTQTQPILNRIADGPLQLADLIREGLAANDRIKYHLTLLQAIAAHAERPFAAVPDLRMAREAAGIADASLDAAAALSHSLSDGVLVFPGAERLRTALFADLRCMVEPLRAAPADVQGRARLDSYIRRVEACEAAVPEWWEDQVDSGAIEALTSVGEHAFHRLVMDLHKELNALLATVAVESIDGARVLSVAPQDRPLIAAFMKGLHATAGLKFDHPGLGTTAARSQDVLSIQNDLGTTDGHVIVIRITGVTATLIYADVHARRLRFLQDLLSPHPIEWREGLSRTGGLITIVGAHVAAGQAALEQFLTHLASRLVFLIDWNRARKQLARFVSRRAAVRILTWAADEQIGHRAFLQAGGAGLISAAVDRIAASRPRYGLRLDELIGADAATAFLQSVLRIATTALRDGHSVQLIADRVEVELTARLATPDQQLIDLVAEHAMLVSALIERLRQTLGQQEVLAAEIDAAKTAALARSWAARADALVGAFSRGAARPAAGPALQQLLERADPIADALEECAFVLTLAAADVPVAAVAALQRLADLVAIAARDYVRALEYARQPGSARREDMDEILICVDCIATQERAVADAERSARAVFLDAGASYRDLHAWSEAARCFAAAAHGLAWSAAALRDHTLSRGGGHL